MKSADGLYGSEYGQGKGPGGMCVCVIVYKAFIYTKYNVIDIGRK